MNATPASVRIASFAFSVVATFGILGATVVGMQAGAPDTTQLVAMNGVIITATKLN